MDLDGAGVSEGNRVVQRAHKKKSSRVRRWGKYRPRQHLSHPSTSRRLHNLTAEQNARGSPVARRSEQGS
eukprot:807138-Rhodomonas_salina.3